MRLDNCFDSEIVKRINTINMKNKNIAIFGYVEVGWLIEEYLMKNRLCSKVVYIDNSVFCDNDEGAKIYNPSAVQNELKNYLILIASSHVQSMTKQLRGYGLKENENYVVLIDLKEWNWKLRQKYMNVHSKDKEIGIDAQKKLLLTMLCRIDTICRQHNLKYYLDSGTLIGAVRHKGFIPWDDDIDVIMPMKDAYELGKYIKEDDELEFVSPFDDESYPYQFPRIMLKNTSTYERFSGHVKMESQLSLDIFIMGGMGNTVDEVRAHLEQQEIVWKQWRNQVHTGMSASKDILRQVYELQTKYDYNNSKYVGPLYGLDMVHWYMEREMFEPAQELQFETDFFCVPKEYDYRLRIEYGDYMIPPKKEQMVGLHERLAYWL